MSIPRYIPMHSEVVKKMIAAIRADKRVGRGTCSCIDEAYSDDELAEAITKSTTVTTVKKAVAWARKVDRMFREREREYESY